MFSKKPDLSLNRGFAQQLFALERRLVFRRYKCDVKSLDDFALKRLKEWDLSYINKTLANHQGNNSFAELEEEEMLLVNSYVNGRFTVIIKFILSL